VLIVIGGVWFTQGIGVLHGSPMTGEATWTIIGAIVVLVGVAFLLNATGRRRRARYEDQKSHTQRRYRHQR
jgi:uncharacterized membrane protein YhiD involved in acid resistance